MKGDSFVKKKMFTKIVILTIVCCLILSGCTQTQTGIDQLLSPPKLSQQQNDIYSALETSSGKNIKLKYPRKGDFTSAFLVQNLDNEAGDEAIVFYEIANSANASLPLRVNVLDQRDGKWVSIYETGVEASDVEKVSFIKSSVSLFIAIGFNQAGQSEKVIKIYTYGDGKLNEMSSTRCNNYEVFDIDGDSVSEVITITTKSLGVDQKTSTATAYGIGSKGLSALSEADMDPSVSEYVNVNGGKLKNGIPALYLDGVKSSTNLSTEILTLQQGELENIVYNQIPELNLVDKTVRFSGSLSLDLNKDGIYYIPNVRPALGYEDAPKHQSQIYTNWHLYTDGDFLLSKSSYIDYKLGFIFTLPKKWEGHVTMEKNSSDNEVIFYEYSENVYNNSKKLLSIKVVKKSEYNQTAINNTHRILKDSGQLMYLYRLYDNGNPLQLSEAEVRENFNLLQGGSSNEKNPGM